MEILHRLEEGHHKQVGMFGGRVDKPGFLGQKQHLQEVGDRVTHRDHIGAADPAAELLLQAVQHPEDGNRLRRSR